MSNQIVSAMSKKQSDLMKECWGVLSELGYKKYTKNGINGFNNGLFQKEVDCFTIYNVSFSVPDDESKLKADWMRTFKLKDYTGSVLVSHPDDLKRLFESPTS